jgi:hypothetical protein
MQKVAIGVAFWCTGSVLRSLTFQATYKLDEPETQLEAFRNDNLGADKGVFFPTMRTICKITFVNRSLERSDVLVAPRSRV